MQVCWLCMPLFLFRGSVTNSRATLSSCNAAGHCADLTKGVKQRRAHWSKAPSVNFLNFPKKETVHICTTYVTKG